MIFRTQRVLSTRIRLCSQETIENENFGFQTLVSPYFGTEKVCWWRGLNPLPLNYESYAPALELYSSKASAGKESGLSRWSIASLYAICYYSSVVDFSSEKYRKSFLVQVYVPQKNMIPLNIHGY